MSRSLLFLIFSLFFACELDAQNVQIVEDPLITKMMERFTEINKSKERIEGWRIQILATIDRQKLERERQTFRYRYPNISVIWVHSSPHYQLRAGAFATKLEALRLKYILERDYPGIYLVKDDSIKPEELIGF